MQAQPEKGEVVLGTSITRKRGNLGLKSGGLRCGHCSKTGGGGVVDAGAVIENGQCGQLVGVYSGRLKMRGS